MTDPAVPVADATSTLLPQVIEVARLRREHAALTDRLDTASSTFLEAWKDVAQTRKDIGARLEQETVALKAAAVALYRKNGAAPAVPGLAVKLKTILQYDAAAALAWAQGTKMALLPESLDVKAFEKIAKATPLLFVTTVDEPQAQLATDLDAALAAAGPALG